MLVSTASALSSRAACCRDNHDCIQHAGQALTSRSRIGMTCLTGTCYSNHACKASLSRHVALTCAQVRLTNGYRVRVHVFVVYDDARELPQAPNQASNKTLFQWPAVSRAQCKKGCQARAGLLSLSWPTRNT